MKNSPNGKKLATRSVIASVPELGLLVRQARKEQGLTQADIAGLANTGTRFLVDLENGKPTIQLQKTLDVMALLGLELVVAKKGAPR
jgi:HTH-type transcriptional regulator/antitoxin HipB